MFLIQDADIEFPMQLPLLLSLRLGHLRWEFQSFIVDLHSVEEPIDGSDRLDGSELLHILVLEEEVQHLHVVIIFWSRHCSNVLVFYYSFEACSIIKLFEARFLS